MHKVHRWLLLMPIVIGFSVTALDAASECQKFGWDTQGWGALLHYYAVGAVKSPGKYIADPSLLGLLYNLHDSEIGGLFACGLTADAEGGAFIIRFGSLYHASLTKDPQPAAQRLPQFRLPIKFNSDGSGLLENDIVYFPSTKRSTKTGVEGQLTILGAVKQPGQYTFKTPLKLPEAIKFANGLTNHAARAGWRLHGGEMVPIQAKSLLLSSAGPEIFDGDVIVITECRTEPSFGPADGRPPCQTLKRAE